MPHVRAGGWRAACLFRMPWLHGQENSPDEDQAMSVAVCILLQDLPLLQEVPYEQASADLNFCFGNRSVPQLDGLTDSERSTDRESEQSWEEESPPD